MHVVVHPLSLALSHAGERGLRGIFVTNIVYLNSVREIIIGEDDWRYVPIDWGITSLTPPKIRYMILKCLPGQVLMV